MAKRKVTKKVVKEFYEFGEGKYVLGDIDELFDEKLTKKVKTRDDDKTAEPVNEPATKRDYLFILIVIAFKGTIVIRTKIIFKRKHYIV